MSGLSQTSTVNLKKSHSFHASDSICCVKKKGNPTSKGSCEDQYLMVIAVHSDCMMIRQIDTVLSQEIAILMN